MNSLKESAKRKDIGRRCELCSRSPQRGFTLLEVLVAITILAIGILALARMQVQAVQSNSSGRQLTEATILAQDKVEDIRLVNKFYLSDTSLPEPAGIQDTQSNWSIDTDGDGILDDFDWATPGPEGIEGPIDVTGAALATGGYIREWCVEDGVPVAKAKTIHVRVRWDNNRQVTLKTVMSQ
jgi:prepilin-type N-terminal cleavage/methylation domain-containing protein